MCVHACNRCMFVRVGVSEGGEIKGVISMNGVYGKKTVREAIMCVWVA